MMRRAHLVAAWLAILGAPLTLAAPALAIPRVGLLSLGTDPTRPLRWGSFLEMLRELGYVEGQTVTFERRFGSGHRERGAALVADLAETKPDIVVVTGPQETELARAAMPTTPVVFVFHPDPVGAGAVQSLSRPGGYVTGVTPMGLELVAKRIELARETFPGLKRLARLVDPATPSEPGYRRATAAAARVFGIQVVEAEADRPEALDTALASLLRQRPDVLYVPFVAPFSAGRSRIVDFCARHRLPCLFEVREFVDDGGLMSYGPRLSDLFRVAARLVDKILKGAKPADLPVEQPTKYELVVNLKAARGLGLTIPPAVLTRVDEIIQ
jgi:ABC-type uncharacterized transport system substrate-binding protein